MCGKKRNTITGERSDASSCHDKEDFHNPSIILDQLQQELGAFVLGLAYGVLSGSCTFGFIAPILAIITIQQKIMIGIVYIILFGIGHCIPIALAGSSTAKVRKLLEIGGENLVHCRFLACGGNVAFVDCISYELDVFFEPQFFHDICTVIIDSTNTDIEEGSDFLA